MQAISIQEAQQTGADAGSEMEPMSPVAAEAMKEILSHELTEATLAEILVELSYATTLREYAVRLVDWARGELKIAILWAQGRHATHADILRRCILRVFLRRRQPVPESLGSTSPVPIRLSYTHTTHSQSLVFDWSEEDYPFIENFSIDHNHVSPEYRNRVRTALLIDNLNKFMRNIRKRMTSNARTGLRADPARFSRQNVEDRARKQREGLVNEKNMALTHEIIQIHKRMYDFHMELWAHVFARLGIESTHPKSFWVLRLSGYLMLPAWLLGMIMMTANVIRVLH